MIVIVSGLPRSGTSLMMQCSSWRDAILIDDHRPADADNPRLLEYEPVKRLQQDNSWMHKAEGKAVKVVSHCSSIFPHNTPTRSSSCSGLCKKYWLLKRTCLEPARCTGRQAPMIRRSGPSCAASQPHRALVGAQQTHAVLPGKLPRNDCRPWEQRQPCGQFISLPLVVEEDGPCRRSTPAQAAQMMRVWGMCSRRNFST